MEDRLSKWLILNCNGDWEHENGVTIRTLDNPGWYLKIDVIDTPLESIEYNAEVYVNEINWYSILLKNKVYKASASLDNLNKIIDVFFEKVFDLVGDMSFFEYDAFVPFRHNELILYRKVICVLNRNLTLKVVCIPDFKIHDIKASVLEDLEKISNDVLNSTIEVKINEDYEVCMVHLFDGNYPMLYLKT